MPLILIYNLSEKEFEKKAVRLIKSTISKEILSITELKLSENDIDFSFLKDPTIISDNVPVTIIVELLLDDSPTINNARTVSQLAQRIGYAFNKLPWNNNRKVTVAVRRFNYRENGYFRINANRSLMKE